MIYMFRLLIQPVKCKFKKKCVCYVICHFVRSAGVTLVQPCNIHQRYKNNNLISVYFVSLCPEKNMNVPRMYL